MNTSAETFLLNAVHPNGWSILQIIAASHAFNRTIKEPADGVSLVQHVPAGLLPAPAALHIAGELVKQCSHPGGEFEVEYVLNPRGDQSQKAAAAKL